MKKESGEPVESATRQVEPRARIIRRVPCGARPPVKRRLFAVGGASQPGRVRLTVGAVTSSSAPTASRDHPAPDTETAPSVLRTQQPPKTFQRSHRKAGCQRSQPPALWLKVGDKDVLDFKISMGHQQEVMASELCDLDTKQTVLVRPAFDDTSMTNTSGYNCSVDCNGINWQAGYSQCYTPPGHPTQTMPQYPTASITPEQGGDCRRPLQCAASQPPGVTVPQGVCRPDGDASSLMWLLDYRLDHLLEPTQEPSPHAPPPPPPPPPPPQQPPVSKPRNQPPPPSNHLPLETAYSSCCQRTTDCSSAERKCDHDFRTSQDMLRQQGYYANSTTKPPFTYTELIEQAMLEEGELTVSGIYKWITSHFGFYKSCDDRWKNSVRHNLSMNPYFRKGDKAKGGSGHLWTLANVEGRRVRRNNVAARMGRPGRKVGGRRIASGGGGGWPPHQSPSSASLLSDETELDLCDDIPSPANDIWLSSAAENKENMPITGEYSIEYLDYVPDQMVTGGLLQTAPPTTTFTLEESADRILNGTNSHVEVQFITPVRNDRIGQDPMLVDYQALDVAMQS